MGTRAARSSERRRCGLCGKTKGLIQSDCCGQWICDDEHKYVIFSYARNSCHRNHRRFTLCGYHHAEGHAGPWKECGLCRSSFETEDYVWYGTNEYNFEKLDNPPSYEPTHCSTCGSVIILSEESYSRLGAEYWCESCTAKKMAGVFPPASTTSRPRAHSRSGRK